MPNTVTISLRDPAVAKVFESVEPGDSLTVTLDVMIESKDKTKVVATVTRVVEETEDEEEETMKETTEAPDTEEMPAPAPGMPMA